MTIEQLQSLASESKSLSVYQLIDGQQMIKWRLLEIQEKRSIWHGCIMTAKQSRPLPVLTKLDHTMLASHFHRPVCFTYCPWTKHFKQLTDGDFAGEFQQFQSLCQQNPDIDWELSNL